MTVKPYRLQYLLTVPTLRNPRRNGRFCGAAVCTYAATRSPGRDCAAACFRLPITADAFPTFSWISPSAGDHSRRTTLNAGVTVDDSGRLCCSTLTTKNSRGRCVRITCWPRDFLLHRRRTRMDGPAAQRARAIYAWFTVLTPLACRARHLRVAPLSDELSFTTYYQHHTPFLT